MTLTSLLLARICLAAAFAGAGLAQSPDQKEFKSLLERYWQAWGTLDPDKAAPFYAKDAGLVFYDVAPLKYTGWEDYKQGVVKAFADFSGAAFHLADDLKIGRSGNLAWTAQTATAALKAKTGAVLEMKLRHTAVWERRGGKWLIIHEHVSAPLPEEPKK